MVMNIPRHLKHKPIIGVDYENIDCQPGFGDAKFLSIGKAQWDNSKYSVKSFRESDNGWSPQSEELHFWRNLDMTILLLSVLSKSKSGYLNEEIIDKTELQKLIDDLGSEEMSKILNPRLKELKHLLDKIQI